MVFFFFFERRWFDFPLNCIHSIIEKERENIIKNEIRVILPEIEIERGKEDEKMKPTIIGLDLFRHRHVLLIWCI